MYNVFTGVLVLDCTVKLFVKGALAAALYVTLMIPVSPGLIGVLVNSATEQPHVGTTFEMIMGSLPVFVNLKL